jgi:hypothetical protein
MSKTVTTIKCTPEELVSRVAMAIDQRIESLKNQNQKPEQPVTVSEVSRFLKRSENWVRRETGLKRIPGHRDKNGRGHFYFFLSEIVEWIKSGRIVSNEELMSKANEYVNSKIN